MRFYMLEGAFKENQPKGEPFQAALEAHHAYLKGYFDSGAILVSGPKAKGGGGIIILKLEDSADIAQFCAADPFVTAGIQDYRVTEFQSFDCLPSAKAWFES